MESLLQELIRAFGWSILNSVWQSGIIYAVLLTILLLAPKLSAKIRHNLAYAAVCGMFGWFLITFFGHVNFSKPNATDAPLTFSEIGFYLSNLPQTFSQKAEAYFPLIVSAYLVGILIQLFVIIKGYVFLRKLKTKQLSDVPQAWQTSFDNITAVLGLSRKIRFQLSGLVNVPVVAGYLKPIVLFPLSLVTQLDSEQVEAILIHELSHIRRNDYLLNLIKTCIETLMFFNPFVWLAGKFIQIEREHACDDLVLRLLGKPLTYAHALLKLELIKESASPAYALAATGKTQYLYQRIKRITNMKTNYLNTKQQMAALTLAVAGLLSVAWTSPQVKEKAKEVTKKISQTLTFTSNQPSKIGLASDTTKKKVKMKIIITDDKGATKEYNSISEIPDSLKGDLKIRNFKNNHFVYSFDINDSTNKAFKFNDSTFNVRFKTINGTLYNRFNSPEARDKWEKFGKEMDKAFNSPEAKVKWQKFGEEMQKKLNSPEAKAKWEKFGKEMEKEFSSPEAQAKWKKFGEEMQNKFNSPEFKLRQLELLNKMGDLKVRGIQLDSMNKILSIRGVGIDSLNRVIINNRIVGAGRLKGMNMAVHGMSMDSLISRNHSVKGMLFLSEDNELRNNAEYKKLKEKFDKDVEDLKKKQKEEDKSKAKPAKKVGAVYKPSINYNVSTGTNNMKYTIASSLINI